VIPYSDVLVVANTIDRESGYVGQRLREHGLRLVTVYRDRGQVPLQPDPSVGMVLLLGSEWSVAEPVDRAALDAECALVRSAVGAGIPVLGLCYGGQVVAAALGGRVAQAPEPEIGLVTVETADESVVPAGPWWAFHLDVIDAPPGAEVVAKNGCGAQAFATERVLGVQFHPEVLPETLDDWCSRFPELVADSGSTREGLVAQARAAEDDSRRAAYALVDAFLERGTRR